MEYDPNAKQSEEAAAKAAEEAAAKEAEDAAAKATEEANAAQESARQAAVKEKADLDIRMGQLEGQLKARFESKQPPPTAAPVETRPKITDEDFMEPASAHAAAERLAEEKALIVAEKLDATYRAEVNELREDSFNSKYTALATEPYFKYVQGQIDEAIRANPDIRKAPKALAILYNNLVGQNTAAIIAAEKEAEKNNDPAPDPLVSHRIMPEMASRRTTPAPPGGPVVEPDTAKLDADEEAMRQKFIDAGVNISADRWATARDAKRRAPTTAAPDMSDGRGSR